MVAKTERVVKVAVEDMQIGYGTQARAEVSTDTVKDFAEAMKRGDEFPPVILYEEDRTEHYEGKKVLIVGDGFKRRAAAQMIGLAELEAVVRKGTKFDALMCNITENQKQQAERWSLKDRRHSVRMVLGEPEGLQKTDSWIADLCGVSADLVATVRREMEQETGRPGPSRRVGRDRKSYPAHKPKGGKASDNGQEAKQGAPKYDWREFNRCFGVVARAPDEIVRAYPNEKEGTEHPAASRLLDTLAKVMKGWEKSLAKQEKKGG